MINGVLNIYKEKGFTSFDVVAKLRGILHQKKIGHTGTLDPDAEGVLPVCLGKATKLCEWLTDKQKTYEAVLRLGITTDTQDMTGTVLSEHEVMVSESEAEACILSFLGEQMQIPPMYSALKVNGRKLYELAREGKVIEREARKVVFYEIKILEMKLPLVRFQVTCSKGTYIRTLCHDIGNALSCGGCMESLLRTKVERFEVKDSLKLSRVEELSKLDKLSGHIIPVDEMFSQYPKRIMDSTFDKVLHNGNAVRTEAKESNGQRVRIYDSAACFIGVYEFDEEKRQYRPLTMFYSPDGQ